MDCIDLVMSGNYLKLLEQLKLGLDPNYAEDGVSLLHYAVVFDQYSIVKLLLDWGANPNQEDILLGETPHELSHQVLPLYDDSMSAIFPKEKRSLH